MKCINQCPGPAESNISWPTSRGPMSANFCGTCAATWWKMWKHTPAGEGMIISAVKSAEELAETCAEYA